MPFREVTMIEIVETLRLWLGGASQARIAQRLVLDRKTVRRYVRAAIAQGLAAGAGEDALTDEFLVSLGLAMHAPVERPRGDSCARCEEHRAFIAGCLDKGVRLTKVRKLLGRREAHVPYMTLYRFAVAELGFGSGGATIPVADCEAGQEVQLDTGFGGRRTKCNSIWADNADSPTTCLSSDTCYSGGTPFSGTDLEASSYPPRRIRKLVGHCQRCVTSGTSRQPQ